MLAMNVTMNSPKTPAALLKLGDLAIVVETCGDGYQNLVGKVVMRIPGNIVELQSGRTFKPENYSVVPLPPGSTVELKVP